MKITVKNFGPIREARNVRVGPMTIFVGPSNTGKSYLATLIYSVVKDLVEDKFPFGQERKINVDLDGVDITQPEVYKKKDQMFMLIEKCFNAWCMSVSSSWGGQVTYCFGKEVENLIEKERTVVQISDTFGEVIIDLTSPTKSKLARKPKQKLFDILRERLPGICEKGRGLYDETDEDERTRFHTSVKSRVNDISVRYFSERLLSEMTYLRYSESHYLPASRGAIMQSHRMLVGAVIHRSAKVGINRTLSTAPYTGVLSDFMEKLITIEKNDSSTSNVGLFFKDGKQIVQEDITEIGMDMEENIMGGKINIQMSETNYPDFRYEFKRNNKKHDLPLMSVSSMVSELAPVSLFIRRYVKPGHLFILEEPEAHLHPAAQLEISKTLVALVNADVQVLITTHSDYILEKIGNCILESNIQKRKEESASKTTLDKEKAFVYLFNKPMTGKQQNTTVRNIKFHPDTGIVTKDHLDVSSALYNETVGLLNKLERDDD